MAFDRYAGMLNSPVNYVDPTGYCSVDKNGNIEVDENGDILKTDCTVEDFEKLTWEQRLQWLKLFVAQYKLGHWLDDIKGAIGYLASDPYFSKEGGWAHYMDAGVLQAINDGMRIFNELDPIGRGGGAWGVFFSKLLHPKSDMYKDKNYLITLRLMAEQAGVDYAQGLAESQRRYNQSSTAEQIRIDVFLFGVDSYRSLAPGIRSTMLSPLATTCSFHIGYACGLGDFINSSTNPETSWPTLSVFGELLGPVSWFLYGQLQPRIFP